MGSLLSLAVIAIACSDPATVGDPGTSTAPVPTMSSATVQRPAVASPLAREMAADASPARTQGSSPPLGMLWVDSSANRTWVIVDGLWSELREAPPGILPPSHGTTQTMNTSLDADQTRRLLALAIPDPAGAPGPVVGVVSAIHEHRGGRIAYRGVRTTGPATGSGSGSAATISVQWSMEGRGRPPGAAFEIWRDGRAVGRFAADTLTTSSVWRAAPGQPAEGEDATLQPSEGEASPQPGDEIRPVIPLGTS